MSERVKAIIYGLVGMLAFGVVFASVYLDNWSSGASSCLERGGNKYNSPRGTCWRIEFKKVE